MIYNIGEMTLECGTKGVVRHSTLYRERRHHYDFDFWFVEEGNIRVSVGDNCRQIKQGEFTLFFPGDFQELFVTKEVTLKYCHFKIRSNRKSLGCSNPLTIENYKLVSRNKVFLKLASRCSSLISSTAPFSLQRLESSLLELLLGVFETASLSSEKWISALFPLSPPEIGQGVKQYIEENLDKQISVSHLAQIFGLDSSYFCRFFKSKTGDSPLHFISAVKLSHAKVLIERGMKLSVVADAVGYADSFTLSKAYKRKFGTAPYKG